MAQNEQTKQIKERIPKCKVDMNALDKGGKGGGVNIDN